MPPDNMKPIVISIDNLDDMPLEWLYHLLSFLDAKTLVKSVSLLSKKFNKIVTESLYYKSAKFIHFHEAELEALSKEVEDLNAKTKWALFRNKIYVFFTTAVPVSSTALTIFSAIKVLFISAERERALFTISDITKFLGRIMYEYGLNEFINIEAYNDYQTELANLQQSEKQNYSSLNFHLFSFIFFLAVAFITMWKFVNSDLKSNAVTKTLSELMNAVKKHKKFIDASQTAHYQLVYILKSLDMAMAMFSRDVKKSRELGELLVNFLKEENFSLTQKYLDTNEVNALGGSNKALADYARNQLSFWNKQNPDHASFWQNQTAEAKSVPTGSAGKEEEDGPAPRQGQ